jgi:hypothetical protein
MQLTGRVDWAEVFARREKAEPVRDGRVLGGA